MTELAVRQDNAPVQLDPTGGRLVAWAQAAGAANQLAKALVQTGFVPMVGPRNNRRPMSENDVTATILMGDELGFSPLAALRSLYVVHGTPALYSRSMVALALSRGHQVWTEESSPTQVVVCGRRLGSDHVERAVWTMDRARKAGYTSNTKYSETPEEMLYAKAAAEIARKIAPDVLSGVPYSVEDLELEPENQPTQRVTRKAVQRQPKPVTPEPEFDDELAAVRAYNPPPAEDDPKPVKAEKLITDAQSKKLHALMREAGITDRAAGLAYIGDIIQREIASSKELTADEASRAIDQIELEKEPAEPTLDWPAVSELGA